MADTPISGLTALSSVLGTYELAFNAGGTSEKGTADLIRQMIGAFGFLGSTTLGSNAANVSVTLPTGSWKNLLLICQLKGYAATGIAGWQFNADTGTNYSDKIAISSSVTNTSGASRASIRVATTSITAARSLVWAFVRKQASGQVAAVWGGANSDTESAATVPVLYSYAGIWANTSALISSVQLTGNGVNLLSGTDLMVYGTDQA
jgi:hypothetical protein